MFDTTLSAIKEACRRLDIECRSYSGRGMFGKSCVGFAVARGVSPAEVAFKLGGELSGNEAEYGDAFDDILGRSWNQDSLGLGTIVYIPGIAWEDDEEEEDYEPGSEDFAPVSSQFGRD